MYVNTCNFSNCYMAAPQPTLGHSWGSSLTNSMLITAFDTYSSLADHVFGFEVASL